MSPRTARQRRSGVHLPAFPPAETVVDGPRIAVRGDNFRFGPKCGSAGTNSALTGGVEPPFDAGLPLGQALHLGPEVVHGALERAAVRIGGAPVLGYAPVEAGGHAPRHAGENAADADDGKQDRNRVGRFEHALTLEIMRLDGKSVPTAGATARPRQGQSASSGKATASKGGRRTGLASRAAPAGDHAPSSRAKASRVRAAGSTNQRSPTPSRA